MSLSNSESPSYLICKMKVLDILWFSKLVPASAFYDSKNSKRYDNLFASETCSTSTSIWIGSFVIWSSYYKLLNLIQKLDAIKYCFNIHHFQSNTDYCNIQHKITHTVTWRPIRTLNAFQYLLDNRIWSNTQSCL